MPNLQPTATVPHPTAEVLHASLVSSLAGTWTSTEATLLLVSLAHPAAHVGLGNDRRPDSPTADLGTLAGEIAYSLDFEVAVFLRESQRAGREADHGDTRPMFIFQHSAYGHDRQLR